MIMSITVVTPRESKNKLFDHNRLEIALKSSVASWILNYAEHSSFSPPPLHLPSIPSLHLPSGVEPLREWRSETASKLLRFSELSWNCALIVP